MANYSSLMLRFDDLDRIDALQAKLRKYTPDDLRLIIGNRGVTKVCVIRMALHLLETKLEKKREDHGQDSKDAAVPAKARPKARSRSAAQQDPA